MSGLAGLPVEQDRWHLDLVIGASPKALMCPPGIGLVGVSAKAWAVIERGDSGCFFWEFRKASAALDKMESAFTPPVSLLAGLAEALRMIDVEGIANVLACHRRLAAGLRAGLTVLDLAPFSREACHTIGEGAKNRVGPLLNGLDGHTSGTIQGLAYSNANKNSGIVWTEAQFLEYIKDPKAKIPGTKMIFPGDQERR